MSRSQQHKKCEVDKVMIVTFLKKVWQVSLFVTAVACNSMAVVDLLPGSAKTKTVAFARKLFEQDLSNSVV